MEKRVRTEQEIIRQALEVFQRDTRLVTQALPAKAEAEAGFVPDVVISVTSGGKTWRFPAIVKTNINPATMGAAIGRLTPVLAKGLLLTRYVTPNMAEELREKGVQFLDTAGNAYMNAPPLFVFVKGHRPIEAVATVKTKRAFQASGLQVLFALLLRPALATAPYRDIAREADVALGTVGWVLRDLRELGYLVDLGHRGRRLTRRAELLERWITAYPDQLRPKLVIGRFSATSPKWQDEAGNIATFGACWGGEPAAAHLTGLLRHQAATVYIRGDANAFILRNKLRKDPQGNVDILKAFWTVMMQKKYGDQAPPLVVYADLLATADPRNIEIAKVIYEQNIDGLVRED
ncbi:MAG: type IV toxin-antitoxin system AbiEi family antitoxin [Desulfurivibrionaceae bacterium]